jgi:hypothetical protein
MKEKIIVDVNAIMLENKKKRRKTSSVIPNKVITKVSLFQEEGIGETISNIIKDTGKPIANVDKHAATSSVLSKVVEVAIEEGIFLKDVDTKHILKVEVLQEEVAEDYIVE